MALDSLPKYILLNIDEPMDILVRYSVSKCTLTDMDIKNILMDIFQDISEAPMNIHTKVSIDTLSIANHIRRTQEMQYEFMTMCNRVKISIMNLVIELGLIEANKKHSDFFNYYLQEIKSNSVMITHLQGQPSI